MPRTLVPWQNIGWMKMLSKIGTRTRCRHSSSNTRLTWKSAIICAYETKEFAETFRHVEKLRKYYEPLDWSVAASVEWIKKIQIKNRDEDEEHFLLKTLAKSHPLGALLLRWIDWDFVARIESMSAEMNSLWLTRLAAITWWISVTQLPINAITVTF